MFLNENRHLLTVHHEKQKIRQCYSSKGVVILHCSGSRGPDIPEQRSEKGRVYERYLSFIVLRLIQCLEVLSTKKTFQLLLHRRFAKGVMRVSREDQLVSVYVHQKTTVRALLTHVCERSFQISYFTTVLLMFFSYSSINLYVLMRRVQ